MSRHAELHAMQQDVVRLQEEVASAAQAVALFGTRVTRHIETLALDQRPVLAPMAPAASPLALESLS